MPPPRSAGILLFRERGGRLEVLLTKPGGPFWKNKDAGAWTIPKGEVAPGEDLLAAAKREFEEELGVAPRGDIVSVGSVKQKGGKVVHAWAVQGDLDVTAVKSNTFEMEWPPRSGKKQAFPEVDRAEWFDPAAARVKINAAQAGLIDALERLVSRGGT